MITPIVLFIIGALFGFHILTHVLRSKPTPKISVFLHGLFVAIALIIVIIAVAQGNNGMLTASMVFFIIAALGGFFMAYVDFGKKQTPPKGLTILHPILAVVGLVLLIVYVAGR